MGHLILSRPWLAGFVQESQVRSAIAPTSSFCQHENSKWPARPELILFCFLICVCFEFTPERILWTLVFNSKICPIL